MTTMKFRIDRRKALGLMGGAAAASLVPVLPLEMHIRFLREARPGAPLVMRGGLVDASETEATFYAELRHAGNATATAGTRNRAHALFV